MGRSQVEDWLDGLQMLKRNCKCTEWVLDCRQKAVFWLGSWAWGIRKAHRKNYNISKFYIRCLGWNFWNGLHGMDISGLGQEQWICFICHLIRPSGRLFIEGNELRFWKVSSPILAKKTNVSEEPAASITRLENRSSKFIQSIGTLLATSTASHSPLWWPRYSHIKISKSKS